MQIHQPYYVLNASFYFLPVNFVKEEVFSIIFMLHSLQIQHCTEAHEKSLWQLIHFPAKNISTYLWIANIIIASESQIRHSPCILTQTYKNVQLRTGGSDEQLSPISLSIILSISFI